MRSSSVDNILADYADQSFGASVRAANVSAASAVAECVRSSLGPRGMDKMIVPQHFSTTGNIVVTNSSVTILEEMKLENPVADMFAEIALEQQELVGDGTTTSVLVAGELLIEAAELIQEGFHPSTIVSGYQRASRIALEELEGSTLGADKISNIPQTLVMTAMVGKSGGGDKQLIARQVLEALDRTADNDDDSIKMITTRGGRIEDTSVHNGVIIDKERVQAAMPETLSDASVALLDGGVQFDEHSMVPKVDTDKEFRIEDSEVYSAVVEREKERVMEMAKKAVETGANVLFARRFVDDLPHQFFADHDVLVVRHVDIEDLEYLSRATGAEIAKGVDELSADGLGHAKSVSHEEIGEDRMIRLEGTTDSSMSTILVRGGTEHVVEEVERMIENGLAVGRLALNDGRVVPGAGAIEMELSKAVRDRATEVSSREQFAIESFADALEAVPRTLAANAGHDRLDTVLELRTRHDRGETAAGVGQDDQPIIDAVEHGVIEPLAVKEQAIKTAAQVVAMVLRVDGLISTESLDDAELNDVADRVEQGQTKEEAIEEVVEQR